MLNFKQLIPIMFHFKALTLGMLTLGLIATSENLSAQATTLVTRTVIASGLDNPRGIVFGSNGEIYVAEAGRGGPGPLIQGPELGVLLAYGATGAVTRIQNGSQERIITGLPSLALSSESAPPPGATGSRGPALGPHDLGFDSNGNLFLLLGYGSNPDFKSNLGIGGTDLGLLLAYTQNSNGTWERRADFAADLTAFEQLYNSDQEDLISNPYSLEIQNNSVLVVDAGANDLLRINNQGAVSLETILASRSLGERTLQSVPTAIAIGPDGAYYVAELTGFPYPEGEARIYRIQPGEAPVVYADGFTQITGLDFDTAGNLYVLEYAVNSLASSPNALNGTLIQISPNGVRTTLIGAGEGLIAPNGLAVGPDDAIYLSNFSTFAGQGQVLRLERTPSIPESSFCLSLLTFGLGGVILKILRYSKFYS